MKKSYRSLLPGAVAAAGMLCLFFTVSCNTAPAGQQVQPAATAPAAQGSIVYIQMDTLINHYDMFNDLRSELESKFNTIQNDLNKKARAFDNDAKDFQEKMNKGLLTRSQAESLQNDLMQRQQELQAYSQQKQMEMAEEEAVMVNRVMDAVKTYVAEYNKTHGYALILTSTVTTNTVLAGSPELDITQDVLKGLNEAYIKNRNK